MKIISITEPLGSLMYILISLRNRNYKKNLWKKQKDNFYLSIDMHKFTCKDRNCIKIMSVVKGKFQQIEDPRYDF